MKVISPSPAELLIVSPPNAFVAPIVPAKDTSPVPEVITNKSSKEVASLASILIPVEFVAAKLTLPAPVEPVSIVVVPSLAKLTPEVLKRISLLAVIKTDQIYFLSMVRSLKKMVVKIKNDQHKSLLLLI